MATDKCTWGFELAFRASRGKSSGGKAKQATRKGLFKTLGKRSIDSRTSSSPYHLQTISLYPGRLPVVSFHQVRHPHSPAGVSPVHRTAVISMGDCFANDAFKISTSRFRCGFNVGLYSLCWNIMIQCSGPALPVLEHTDDPTCYAYTYTYMCL